MSIIVPKARTRSATINISNSVKTAFNMFLQLQRLLRAAFKSSRNSASSLSSMISWGSLVSVVSGRSFVSGGSFGAVGIVGRVGSGGRFASGRSSRRGGRFPIWGRAG